MALLAVEASRSIASLADKKEAVLTEMGVRGVCAAGPSAIRVIIGPSVTPACGLRTSYRIVSEEDENYAYEGFVMPVDLKMETSADGETEIKYPLGFTPGKDAVKKSLSRTSLVLQLPSPMIEGKDYSVVAMGNGGQMVTAGRSGGGFVYREAEIQSARPALCSPEAMTVLGLRGISSIGNGIIMLEFGHAFDPVEGSRISNYEVTVNGRAVIPGRIGRRTQADVYYPVGWPFKAFLCHEIFLDLGSPLQDGSRIKVKVASPAVTTGASSCTMTFENRNTFSPSIKVNQIGYLPDSPVKNAYLGRWLGSFPESESPAAGGFTAQGIFGTRANSNVSIPSSGLSPSALSFTSEPEFVILEENSGKEVYKGMAKLRHNGLKRDGKANHSGENVYLLDFTDFKVPGSYVISIAGVGRSLPFRIGDDVYKEAFQVQAQGIYMQRCGEKLQPPYSNWRRISCHSSGVTATNEVKYAAKKDFGNFEGNEIMVPNPEYNASKKDALPNGGKVVLHMPLSDSLVDLGPNRLTAAPDYPVEFDSCLKSQNGNNGFTVKLPMDLSKGATILFNYIRTVSGNSRLEGDLISLRGSARHEKGIALTAFWGLFNLCVERSKTAFRRINDNKWHHIAITIQPGGKDAKLFFDGVEMLEVKSGRGPTGTFLHVMCINGNEAEGSGMKNLTVVNEVLPAGEIAKLSRPVEPVIPLKLHISGGHHDAGDYNPRSHLDVAQELMDSYEIAPDNFHDGQLNIPENKNGIPDLLDEALWALKLWKGLQNEDGSVRNGTESAGDPDFIQTVEMDNKGDYAWKEDCGGSFWFAGAAAQMSRLLMPYAKEAAADYLERAMKAYRWAVQNPPKTTNEEKFASYFVCSRAYAAAQLLHATGESIYNSDFIANTPWTSNPKAEMIVYRKYDLSRAAYAYANLPDNLATPMLRDSVRKAIRREADMYISGSNAMAYRFIRHPFAPIAWGSGAYENFQIVINQAWRFSREPVYKEWMIRTCDNTLGANPMNLCWITGLGERCVHAPLHNSRYNPTGFVVRGQQVQGPNAAGEGYAYRSCAFPAHSNDFAVLYSFADMHFAIVMDEGTVSSQVKTLATFGLLLPPAK